MADIAVVFGWSPDITGPMSVATLMRWRHEAVERASLLRPIVVAGA